MLAALCSGGAEVSARDPLLSVSCVHVTCLRVYSSPGTPCACVLWSPVIPAIHAALPALLVNRSVGATSPPAVARALVLEWRLLRQAGMFEAALEAAQLACTVDPASAAAWSALGYSLVELGWVAA